MQTHNLIRLGKFGVKLVLSSVVGPCRDMLLRSHALEHIGGPSHVFLELADAVSVCEEAISLGLDDVPEEVTRLHAFFHAEEKKPDSRLSLRPLKKRMAGSKQEEAVYMAPPGADDPEAPGQVHV